MKVVSIRWSVEFEFFRYNWKQNAIYHHDFCYKKRNFLTRFKFYHSLVALRKWINKFRGISFSREKLRKNACSSRVCLLIFAVVFVEISKKLLVLLLFRLIPTQERVHWCGISASAIKLLCRWRGSIEFLKKFSYNYLSVIIYLLGSI